MSKCSCVTCGECGGNGIVFFSAQREYLGSRRSDDLDDFEGCGECHGTGVSETCRACEEEMERAREHEDFAQ